jgi:hypothetical protein
MSFMFGDSLLENEEQQPGRNMELTKELSHRINAAGTPVQDDVALSRGGIISCGKQVVVNFDTLLYAVQQDDLFLVRTWLNAVADKATSTLLAHPQLLNRAVFGEHEEMVLGLHLMLPPPPRPHTNHRNHRIRPLRHHTPLRLHCPCFACYTWYASGSTSVINVYRSAYFCRLRPVPMLLNRRRVRTLERRGHCGLLCSTGTSHCLLHACVSFLHGCSHVPLKQHGKNIHLSCRCASLCASLPEYPVDHCSLLVPAHVRQVHIDCAASSFVQRTT